MGPSDVQLVVNSFAWMPFNITLSSGEVILLTGEEELSVGDMTLTIIDKSLFGQERIRIISIPNIAMIQTTARKERR